MVGVHEGLRGFERKDSEQMYVYEWFDPCRVGGSEATILNKQ